MFGAGTYNQTALDPDPATDNTAPASTVDIRSLSNVSTATASPKLDALDVTLWCCGKHTNEFSRVLKASQQFTC